MLHVYYFVGSPAAGATTRRRVLRLALTMYGYLSSLSQRLTVCSFFLKRNESDCVCVRTCVTKKRRVCDVCSVLLIHTYDRTRKKKEKKEANC